MTDFWTPISWQRITAGQWLTQPANPTAVIHGVSIDSRSAMTGCAFVAIPGDRFDGHDFLSQAAEAGAAMLVASDQAKATSWLATHAPSPSPLPVLLVPDTIKALQDLARAYRHDLKRSGTRIVAVTGSNGKTSTRHLIHSLLTAHPDPARAQGTQSPKSFNNHLGVPLTILGARVGDGFVVVEVGTNHPGEIAALGGIVRPDIAVITNIGFAHLEGLGTPQAIAAEKASLLQSLSPNGLAVVPGDEPLLSKHLTRLPPKVTVIRFGEDEDSDIRLTTCRADDTGVTFTVESPDPSAYRLPLLGRHQARNALAAIAVARAMGVDNASVTDALATVEPVNMRLTVHRFEHVSPPVVLINDAYNANPSSVAVALHTLADYPMPAPRGRHVAILGDMAELGDQSDEQHQRIGRLIRQINRPTCVIHDVILIGEASASFTAAAITTTRHMVSHVHAFPSWRRDLPALVAELLQPGDVVLIKASRSMGLEQLIPAIEARFAAPVVS